jgi:hypothetical protein
MKKSHFSSAIALNPAVEQDGHKLFLWLPTLRSGHPLFLR